MRKNNQLKLFYKVLFITAVVVIVYNVIYYIHFATLNYTDYVHLTNNFNKDELLVLQQCTHNSTNTNLPCFEDLHKKLVTVVKEKLKIDYLHIAHARFSNNTNNDGGSFHRDIQPQFLNYGPYPKVYTIIFI
jgi:uncharacterized protein (UPF0333 family)